MSEKRHEIEISQGLVRVALAGANEIEMLCGLYERLHDAGFALVRASVANDVLDPTFGARGVRWVRSQGGFEEPYARMSEGPVSENRAHSPFSFLLKSRQPILRRRLKAAYRRGEFPMLDQFQDDGVTDYVAFAVGVGESVRLGEGKGIVASWTTDAPDGFTEAQIELLAGIMPTLTLVFLLRTTHRTARTVLTTYLGTHAAERVLARNADASCV